MEMGQAFSGQFTHTFANGIALLVRFSSMNTDVAKVDWSITSTSVGDTRSCKPRVDLLL